MPQVAGGPKELNDLLEKAYQSCIKAGGDEATCSKKAWEVAKNTGWSQDKDGNWVKSSLETRELNDVEIFKTGMWGGRKYTKEDIDEIVTNTNELLEKKEIKIPGKLGHSEKQPVVKKEGMNAVGWITKVKKKANRILADFTQVPLRLYELFQAGAYRPVSCEIYPDYKSQGQVLRAVAFLGADIPEVKGLEDMETLYHSGTPGLYEEDELPYDVCYFDAEGGMFREEKGNNKKTDEFKNYPTKIYTLDELAKICPSCAEQLKSRGFKSVRLPTIIEAYREQYEEFKKSGAEHFQWGSLPEGWDKGSLDSFWNSIGGSVDACVDAMKGRVVDEGAFCASLKDIVEGKKAEHTEGGEGKMGEKELKAKEEELVEKEKAMKLKETELKTKESDLEKKEEESKVTAKKLSEVEAGKKKEMIDTFVEKLKKEGRILPKHEEHIRTLLTVADDKNVVKFGEKKEEKTPLVILMEQLSSQPEVVKFQELLGYSPEGKPFDFKFTEEEQKEISGLPKAKQDWLQKLSEMEVAMLKKLDITPIDYVKFNEPPEEK